MSTVASTSAASPTGSATCANANYNKYPTTDVFCAVASTQGLPDNYGDILKGCCKSAPVDKYADDCALYCLVVDQSVADINKCFQDGGVKPQFILCNGNNTASATGHPTASVASTGSPTASGATKTDGSTAKPSSSTGAAAPGAMGMQGVSKTGLGMIGLLFVSTVVGTFL